VRYGQPPLLAGAAAGMICRMRRTHPRPKRLGLRKVGLRNGALLAVLFACGAWFVLTPEGAAQPRSQPSRAEAKVLRGGWFPLDPYQYREYRRGTAVLTGYDIEIERALARILRVDIQLPEVAWEEHLAAVAAGKADIAAGATFSEERARYAYFSKPYRQETDVVILRQGIGARYRFGNVAEMLEAFKRQQFRLGVIAGFTYASDRVNAYIADPAHDASIVKVGDDTENLRNLLAGTIDGFIADRIVAATVAWRQQKSGEIEEYPLYMSTPIHFMLSRISQSPAMLDRLNGAIDEIRRSGEIKRIADAYALPILIHQTLDTGWFKALALLGTIAFTLSGVVLAHAGRYTLFGALVLASIPALGGGVLRDLIVQREPLGVVRDPLFVLAVIATVMLGMAFFKLASFGRAERLVQPLRARRAMGTHLIEVCDALGLAAFTVLGVVVILDTSVHPLWLWGPISAVIGSSFGGLIRDMIRQDGELASLKGQLYPEIAMIWGLAFSLFLGWEAERLQPEEIWFGVVVTIAGAFLTRMAAVALGLKGWPYA
jgi:polar amino acid transport system substrate-binding protein